MTRNQCGRVTIRTVRDCDNEECGGVEFWSQAAQVSTSKRSSMVEKPGYGVTTSRAATVHIARRDCPEGDV
jgi:hypothetical protein